MTPNPLDKLNSSFCRAHQLVLPTGQLERPLKLHLAFLLAPDSILDLDRPSAAKCNAHDIAGPKQPELDRSSIAQDLHAALDSDHLTNADTQARLAEIRGAIDSTLREAPNLGAAIEGVKSALVTSKRRTVAVTPEGPQGYAEVVVRFETRIT